MGLARRLKTNPVELAKQVIEAHPKDECIDTLDVAGPGFINIRLNDDYLAKQVSQSELVTTTTQPQRVVIDYSSPNLAKELHVGHLRSTIIGDAVALTLELAGHTVLRQNHIGDWGTAFGRLLAYLDDVGKEDTDLTEELSDLEKLYVQASTKFDTDPQFADRSREMVLALQDHDPTAMAKWRHFMSVSASHMSQIYDRLGVSLQEEHIRGESAYNNVIPGMLEDLQSRDFAVESDGALAIFMDQFKNKDGEIPPMLVRKSDGGFLYHTTDLADVRYRQTDLNADRMLWFTDARQTLHFDMLFAAAKLVGYVKEDTSLEFHPFGSILGKDGKPLKSRSGGSVHLNELLDEAVERTRQLISARETNLSEQELEHVVNTVAMGAVKYADLSKNSQNDYMFDWDEMLSLDGNTAPYLQYAYARICGIFDRAGRELNDAEQQPTLTTTERALALTLLRFQETIDSVVRDAKPHYLCSYLYDLTVSFMRFYESCPILNSDESTREGRLTLCSRTANTLRTGLKSLGIDVLEQM